ncbi:MAG: GNAT family N-acetyltransferase [Spongiibacteraceae bacterium]
MIVRVATVDDAKPVVDFLRQFRAENLQTVLWHVHVPSVHEEARFLTRLKNESGVMLVALKGGVIIGCLTAEIHQHPQLRHSCEFGLSVLQAYRSQGIGSALIAGLLQWSTENRIRRIELNVFSNNHDAIRLYQRLGFKEEGRKVQAVYVEPEYVDLIEMAFILSMEKSIVNF